jgi:hypothetical protein
MSERNQNRERIGYISFTAETIEEFIQKYNTQTELLQFYIDNIRNGRYLNDESLSKIEQFDSDGKIKLIREFNRVMKIFSEYVDKN